MVLTGHAFAGGRAAEEVVVDEITTGAENDLENLTRTALVDDEVRRIIDECYAHAVSMLREHRANLDALVEALLVSETLDEAEAYAIAGVADATKLPEHV